MSSPPRSIEILRNRTAEWGRRPWTARVLVWAREGWRCRPKRKQTLRNTTRHAQAPKEKWPPSGRQERLFCLLMPWIWSPMKKCCYSTTLRVGPYGEKLWPRSWKCCLRPRAVFSRPRSQFFTIRTSQPANNIYLSNTFSHQISLNILNSQKFQFVKSLKLSDLCSKILRKIAKLKCR